jgi:dTDP-4-dehydrorhamnose 3,5-epimerase
VIDIAVDIRKGSLTYGQHIAVELSEENNKMFWIPPGFAHGFSALEDGTIFSYKCTNYYNQQSEDSLVWNDKILNLDWRVEDAIISEKDKVAKKFKIFKTPFAL